MWLDLFEELVGKDDMGFIWYVSKKKRIYHYTTNIWIITGSKDELSNVDYLFCRGGHKEYIPIIKKCKKAYKTYYGAGCRMFPQDGIHYDMILVDCEHDRKKAVKKYPKSKIVLWTKPAARHFKPVDVEKKYDVCYVCPNPKDKRKRVNWVYKTIPKDLRMLQLGNIPNIKVPKNVKVKRVAAVKMPRMYSKCKLLIAPYTEDDSAPRCIFEALACDVPVLALDKVKINWDRSPHFLIKSTKDNFWKDAKELLGIINENPMSNCQCSPISEFVYYDVGVYRIKNNANLIRIAIHEEKRKSY